MAVDDFLQREYFTLVDLVKDFDQRLITIKGWGVTVSLAALGAGFQVGHFAIFLIAALGALAFWIIEGFVKRHQMRHYVRMREIEVRLAEGNPPIPRPQIDWSWSLAEQVFMSRPSDDSTKPPNERPPAPPPPPPQRYGWDWSYRAIWLMPHVMLPHVLTVVAGTALFVLGLRQVISLPL